MTRIALLIVADSATPELEKLLLLTVNSAIASCANAPGTEFSILCAEKNEHFRDVLASMDFSTKVLVVAQSTAPFNYNGELNALARLATRETGPDYFILANSDLEFIGDCIPRLTVTMQQQQMLSASPYDPIVHGIQYGISPDGSIVPGYSIRRHLTGWCIFVQKDALTAIGGLHEGVAFWYSDNIYADQLRKALIDHSLVTDCICEHAGSKTLFTKQQSNQQHLTISEFDKYQSARRLLGAIDSVSIDNNIKIASLGSLQQFLTVCHLLTFPAFERHRETLFRQAVWSFHTLQPVSIMSALFLMGSTRVIMTKVLYTELWTVIKNRLDQSYHGIARFIRWRLIWENFTKD